MAMPPWMPVDPAGAAAPQDPFALPADETAVFPGDTGPTGVPAAPWGQPDVLPPAVPGTGIETAPAPDRPGGVSGQPVNPYPEEPPGPPLDWRPRQSTRKPVRGRKPTYEEEIRGLAGAEGEVAGNLAEIDAARADMRARQAAIMAEQKQLKAQELQRDEMRRRADLDLRHGQLEAERQAVANMRIDPDQWMKEGGEQRRAKVVVGGFLAGFLGDNEFQKAIDGMVERNLAAQKMNIENRKEALTVGERMYQTMYSRYQDERKTDMMFAAMTLDGIAESMDAEIMQLDSPEARQKGLLAKIGIQQKAAALVRQAAVEDQQTALERARISQTSRNRELEWERFGWQKRMDVAQMGAAQAKEAAAREEAIRAKQATVLRDPSGDVIAGGNGEPIFQPDQKHANEENEKLAGRAYALQLLEQYNDWVQANKGRKFGGGLGLAADPEFSIGESLHWKLVVAETRSHGLGAFDKGIQDVIGGREIPGPSSYLHPTNADSVVPQLMNNSRIEFNQYMREKHGYKGNFWDDYKSKHPTTSFRPGDTAVSSQKKEEPPPPDFNVKGETSDGGFWITEDNRLIPKGQVPADEPSVPVRPSPGLGMRPPGPFGDNPTLYEEPSSGPDWVKQR